MKKNRNAIGTLWLLSSFLCGGAGADDWLCRTQASLNRGDSFLACGTATTENEESARAVSLDNARLEYSKFCQNSGDCGLTPEPGRMECEKTPDGVKCYRLLVYKTRGITVTGTVSNATPVVSIGMSKADVIKQFGTPINSDHDGFMYHGSFCVADDYCHVLFTDSKVSGTMSVRPDHTDLLK